MYRSPNVNALYTLNQRRYKVKDKSTYTHTHTLRERERERERIIFSSDVFREQV